VHLKIRVPCEICNAEVVPSALKKHVRSHVKTEEEKSPHKCQQCGRGYPTPGTLRKHVMRVHLEVREECPKCGLQTKDLYRHMRMTQCDRPGYIVRQQKNRNSLDSLELDIVKQEPGYNNNSVKDEKQEMEQEEEGEKGFWLEKEASEGSVSSGGFNGFPSDVEDPDWSGGGSKGGRNSRQEEVVSLANEGRPRRNRVSRNGGGSGRSSVASVAAGSDIMELGDSDGFFASEEESEVMKKKVEPIPITDSGGDTETCDPLDVSQETKPRGRGRGRGKGRGKMKERWNTVIYPSELDSIEENDTKEIKEEDEN